jgi:hypothetical protein
VPCEVPTSAPEHVCSQMAALQEQNRIGWPRFFEGWLSPKWIEAQQRYYSTTKSCKTGHRWVTALIQKLWDTAWDLWEH